MHFKECQKICKLHIGWPTDPIEYKRIGKLGIYKNKLKSPTIIYCSIKGKHFIVSILPSAFIFSIQMVNRADEVDYF